MDAFYASVEQRDNPELRGKPIAVGGGEHRGVTTTASYEARVFGVRSAMPGWKAKQLCPELIFVKPRFEAYSQVSKQIRAIFSEYTELIEPLSLDEAFLDVTENKKGIEHATEVAKLIKAAVLEQTGLTCSAGVSYCKFLAKVASDMNKPDGITIIKPAQALAFLEKLPIEKFFGVGKVTGEKMKKLGIETGADLKTWSKIALAKRFGKLGIHFYDIVRGIDNRPVRNDRKRKSLAIERTFNEDLSDLQDIKTVLIDLIPKFMARLRKADNFGRTLTLKFKTSDFQTLTRSRSFDYFVVEESEIKQACLQLLEENIDAFESIRLLGIAASNLQKQGDDLIPSIGIQLEFDF